MKKFQKHYIVSLIFLVIIFTLATLSLTTVSTKVIKSLTQTAQASTLPSKNTATKVPFVTVMENIPIVNYPNVSSDSTLSTPQAQKVPSTTPKTSPLPTNILAKIVRYIDTAYSGEIAFTPALISVYGGVQKVTGKSIVEDVDSTKNIVKDNHDFLQFYEPYISSTLNQDTKRVATAKAILKAHGIPLLFVQPPMKIIEGYTELSPEVTDFTNENVDRYLKEIHKYGVKYLDLRASAKSAHLDPNSLFFKTDHHWTTQTAFWAFGQTITKLDELGVVKAKDLTYYTDLDHYTLTPYPQSFLGSQGRRVGALYGGLDDYTLITPNFKTEYRVEVNHMGEQTIAEGSFEEALLKSELLDPKAPTSTNRYATYLGQDHGEVIITNPNAEKNLLIIQNSYGLPFSSFMSTCFNNVHIIDLRFFNDCTLEEYIQKYDFDGVIILDDSLLAQ